MSMNSKIRRLSSTSPPDHEVERGSEIGFVPCPADCAEEDRKDLWIAVGRPAEHHAEQPDQRQRHRDHQRRASAHNTFAMMGVDQ